MLSSKAFYLTLPSGLKGQRFSIYHPAEGPVSRGAVVYIHPFAEEMNKSRRMAALQARAFAADGYSVLQMDLFGCGDSSGEFCDATWADWVADVQYAADWVAQRVNGPLWLWGLRAGCLLAVEVASGLNRSVNFLFWQPSTSGKLVLQQFLRLRLAADLLGGSVKGATTSLRNELTMQGQVEVSGYSLGVNLALALENVTLRPVESVSVLHWLELAKSTSSGAVSTAASRCIAEWRSAGVRVFESTVQGPMFWQTVEIEVAPELMVASRAALLAEY